jgi:acetyl esterase/lipase
MSAPTQSETNERRVEASLARTLWRRREMLAAQGYVVTKTLLSYLLIGPPLDSWNLQLMLLTAVAQEGSRPKHAKQGSVKRLRALLALHERMPPPKHLLYAPVSIPVTKRGLPEPLTQADAAESGDRRVPAEWIVHDAVAGQLTDRVILYVHGGAYYSMSVASHRPLCLAMSKALRCRIFSVDYRLAPEDPYPAAIQDTVSAYLHLLDLGIAPENIVISGDSAGGGLSMGTMLYLRDAGLPQLGGGILLSPVRAPRSQLSDVIEPISVCRSHFGLPFVGDGSVRLPERAT